MTAIIGIDPSLTATGIAMADRQETITSEPSGTSVMDRLSRIVTITSQVVTLIPHGSLVVIEGPAYETRDRSGQHHLRAGLWWLLAADLADRSCALVEVSPSTLKKFATGNGAAAKPDMRMALYKRAGIDIADNNQVDAWWLRQIGLHLTEHATRIELPKLQLDALNKIHAQLPAFI